MTQPQASLRGHCRCGSVVMQAKIEPDFSVFCHCDDCRRATGAPVLASVGFLKSDVVWEKDETLAIHKQGTCSRLFCKNCGTPIAQLHESADDKIFINTAFMDEPDRFPPTAHTFEGRQISWLELSDDLPRYEKTIFIKCE